MKYIWETVDIKPGRKVHASNRTEIWMIGYDPSTRSENKYTIISTEDGMIRNKSMDLVDIVGELNGSEMRPVDIRTDDFVGAIDD